MTIITSVTGTFLLRSFRNDGDQFEVGGIGCECWNWLFHNDCQFDSSLLGVNKFLAEVIAWIKPSLQGFWVVAGALRELDDSLARRFQTVVVDARRSMI